MIPFRITFLGTGAVHPTARRGTTAYYVTRGGDKWLVDCGEGTQARLWAATGGLPDIDGILLTHYHADHTNGLMGLVSTLALWGRTRPLSIYGPDDPQLHLQNHVALMSKEARRLLRFHEAYSPVAICDEYNIESFRTHHAAGVARGYVFEEHTKPGKLDAELCRAAGLTGPEMGRVKAGEKVKGILPEDVMGPDQPGRKLVITGDTAPCVATTEAAQGATLLVHEATYTEDSWRPSDHSTAAQAAQRGSDAGVKQLALTHIAARHTNTEIRKEAERIFPGVIVPNDLAFIDL